MPRVVSRKVRDLTSDERRTFERFLGVAVTEEESISVRTFTGTVLREAPVGEARARVYHRLEESMDKIAAGLAGVPDEELDPAIEEAVDYVRHHRK